MIINPNTIIGECLETAWGLPQYMDIISKVNKNAFKASADFRTSFNAYYRVRQRKSEWYDSYYELMENQKHYPLSFEQLLRKLMTFGNIETSFSSKLLATVDVDRPIWDADLRYPLHQNAQEQIEKCICQNHHTCQDNPHD